MKRNIFSATLALVVYFFPGYVNGQTEFEVPSNYILKEKEDYAKYEKDVIAASKWLQEKDLDKEKGKRADVNHFVKEWLDGSPTVNMGINKNLLDLFEKNGQLLYVYIGAYCRWVLENNHDDKNKKAAIKSGLKAIMGVYQKGIEIKKNKEMLKLIGKDEKSEIDDYIEEKFADLLKGK